MKHIWALLIATTLLWSCKNDTPSIDQNIPGFDFVSQPIEVKKQEVRPLTIGDKAPDFRLPGTDRKYHTLSDYDSAEVLVIVFTCNHCPTSQAYETRLKQVASVYQNKNVQLIAISPNSPLGVLYEELGYSDLNDTYEDMIIRADEANFNFPYLYDGDDQKVSLQYGPAATPHSFVFDKDRRLQYVGRVDDSEKPGTGQAEDLRQAIDLLLEKKTIPNPTTKTFGCSTKWGWKTTMRKRVDKEWDNADVTLEEKTLDGIKEVMSNKGDNLRLVNIWATWCAPCRLEYPEFVVISRMFGARDFEFISISADKLEKKQRALTFLTEVNSALPNYIVTDDDKYKLIEAIDPDWNGALPYTALIEPGGNIVWKHQGEVDFQALKRVIVDHPMIGRVY